MTDRISPERTRSFFRSGPEDAELVALGVGHDDMVGHAVKL